MVLSCWQRYMKALAGGVIRYEVKDFARWSKNPSGKSLLKAHLRQAYRDKLPVRMVLAQTDEVDAEVAGIAGSELSKRFLVRDDLVGSVIEFDTGRFIIDFLTA